MKRGTPDHPKTKRLMQILNCDQITAVGILEMVWHWAARYAPQGDIGRWSPEHIAAGIGWGHGARALVDALADAGYFDRHRKHRYLIHDWHEHAEDAVKKYIARNNLTFLTMSRRVRTKSRHVTPAVAVAVASAIAHNGTDNPPIPPTPEAPNGHPPGPPADAGGSGQGRKASDVERVAKAVKAKWRPDDPLHRDTLKQIRRALVSSSGDELLQQVRESEHPPPWLIDAVRARI